MNVLILNAGGHIGLEENYGYVEPGAFNRLQRRAFGRNVRPRARAPSSGNPPPAHLYCKRAIQHISNERTQWPALTN